MADYWDTYQGENDHHAAHGAEVVRYAFDAEEWAGFPVSAIFETYRDAYGLSIEDISDALKIRVDYLVALERGDYKALPGRTFAIGYVRSVANFLQLPSETIVELFKMEAYDMSAPTLASLTILEPPKEKQLSRGLVVLVSLALLIGSWCLWLASANGWQLIPDLVAANENPLEPSVQNTLGADSVDGAEPMILDPADGSMIVVSQTDDPLLARAETREEVFGIPLPQVRPSVDLAFVEPEGQGATLPRVMIEASALAWIQVRNSDNEPIVAQMMQAGQSQLMPAELGLQLTTGSIEALTITVDGTPVRLPRPSADTVVTELSLDPAELQGFGAAL